MYVIALLVLVALSALAQPRTAVIKVNPDGSFSPKVTNIRSGDTVRWEGLTRTDSIISVTGSSCPTLCSPRPFDPTDRNEFTGPMPFAPSGIFTLSPLENGLVETTATACPGGSHLIAKGDNGKILCTGGGTFQATLDSTWRSDQNTGVFIRLLWKDVQPSAGTYDFSVLQREADQAVKYGKLFSVGIKAGDDGTPDWIFSTNSDGSARSGGGGGVPRLKLQASDDDSATGCGNKLDLGNPTRATYKQLYFALLTELARVLKTRSDWYRALAYVKISGANYVSHENRLPNTCKEGCPCNPAIFAADTYRPSTLYTFYDEQNQLLRTLFPGKPISYALIQDGFPRVNETGGYETTAGSSSNSSPLPGNTEQMQTIIDRGQANYGINYVVQHNGLQTKHMACNLEGVHPKPILPVDQYWPIGGCPNRWAVKEGAEGQITGFQTTNLSSINTAEDLDSSFQNAWDNSDAVFIEVYEEVFWVAQNTKNGVLPVTGKTVGGWAADFHRRRVDPIFPNFTRAGDPFPTAYSFTFNRTEAGTAAQTFNFVHGGLDHQELGQIVLDAQLPAVNPGGVVTALQYGGNPAIAPGSWIEIYGSNLATASREWGGEDFTGTSAPTMLNGTSVRIGGQAAYVRFISATQVNAQVPSTVSTGSQQLIVFTPAGASAPYTITVNPSQPGLLAPTAFSTGSRQYVGALFPDGITYVLPPSVNAGVPARRAKAGDVITLYGVGFGPVTPAVPAGQIVQQKNTLAQPFTVNFGQTPAKLDYSGLAPGFIGLYQFNVIVPSVTAGDAIPVTFTLNGTPGSQTLFIAIQ